MDKSNGTQGFGSVCVKRTEKASEQVFAHNMPIYSTSAFVFENAEQGIKEFTGEKKGYIYSRWHNPTIEATEEKIAELEGYGLDIDLQARMFSSGMGAINTLIVSQLKQGDKILTHGSLYGGSEEIFTNIFPSLGIEPIIADLQDLDKAKELLENDPSIKLLYIETPSNPLLKCYDLGALAELAKEYNIVSVVDNTFATPYLQQPFKYGFDFVIHSTTKYLNGHGSGIGGILVGRKGTLDKGHVWEAIKLLGANSNANDAWLIYNGIKTLELRMDRHCSNAMLVAEFLNGHDAVIKVHYVGLPDHADHELAKRQMRAFSGMLSFDLKSGFKAGIDFMNKVELCTRAVSLGTTDSLVQHPASMSHASIPESDRRKYGITDGLIRMSVGIENIQDIVQDLEQAL